MLYKQIAQHQHYLKLHVAPWFAAFSFVIEKHSWETQYKKYFIILQSCQNCFFFFKQQISNFLCSFPKSEHSPDRLSKKNILAMTRQLILQQMECGKETIIQCNALGNSDKLVCSTKTLSHTTPQHHCQEYTSVHFHPPS